ncbi:hypothetical protein PS887_05473 [Pseudomonas fluorescens]|nr:hypothetical protein PS887_05473 [Pseudomonas fluorescens]
MGDRFIRRRRRIALRIRRHSWHIIDRLLTDQRRALGLAAHHRHRVRNQHIARLQRHSRHRLNRRRRTAQQHRLGGLHMGFQPRPHYLLGQQLQQRPRPPGLDATKHLSTQAQLYSNTPCGPDQQQVDQHFAGDFTQQFVHVGWRQHAYPGHQRRQVDKQQRLITEYQQPLGQRVFAQLEQCIQLGLGQVFQQRFAVGLEVGEQVVQLGDVVPQVVKRLAQPGRKGNALNAATLVGWRFGKVCPSRLEVLGPCRAQIRFQPGDHRLIGRIQRLDVSLGNSGVKGDFVLLVAATVADFKNAAGANGPMQWRAYRAAVLCNGLQPHGRVADRHEPRAFEQMYQGQPALGFALSDRAAGLVGRDRRDQCDAFPNLEHLLHAKCRTT